MSSSSRRGGRPAHAAGSPSLYYQLSPELLLFGDSLKRLRSNVRDDDSNVCIAWGGNQRTGGVFLGLPFSKKSSVSSEQRVCTGQQWHTLCWDVMVALVRQWVHAPKRWVLPARLLKCPAIKPDAAVDLEINTTLGVAPMYNITGPGAAAATSEVVTDRMNTTFSAVPASAAHETFGPVGVAAVETALRAVPSNATYDELDAMLVGVLCPAARRRLLETTQCLVGHAEHVRRTIDELGCDAIIAQALNRLGQLSHVLFMDASKFALVHAFEMALRGTNGGEANSTHHFLRANKGQSHEPFIQSEIEPFNRCSLRFYGEAFVAYTARVPHFGALREMDLLHTPIHSQVGLANQGSDEVP